MLGELRGYREDIVSSSEQWQSGVHATDPGSCHPDQARGLEALEAQ